MIEKMLYSEQCTGCKMCSQVCPVSAISFVEDGAGFWYPKVNEERCIQCGLCEKKCPALHPVKSVKNQPEVYAAWAKDKKIRLNSTSGGVCHELSRCVIKEGGYVAGVVYAQDFKSAHYILINDEDGLKKITQTKYFQADADGIYGKVKEKLEEGKTVLFVGTPCYNAALQSYLGKEYEKLIQCEFVCRGNPSPKVHRLHIEYQEQVHGSKIVCAHSKNKRKGWSCFGTYFRFENGREFYKDRYHNPMTIMFIGKNMNTRDCCFSCQYRTVPRVADITVGDFWGITGVNKEDYFNGVSLLMVNSLKGKQLLNKASELLECQKRTLEEVAHGNPALQKDPIKSELIGQFREDLDRMPFGDVMKKYVNKKDIGQKKWRHRLSKVKKALKYLYKMNLLKFIYYNFFCRRVIREKGKYIIPYRGSCVEIKRGGRVYLEGNLFLNTLRMRGSKAECYLCVESGGELRVRERLRLGCQSTIHVNREGYLEVGQMGTNFNCNIQCSNRIIIGWDVMLGRDVMIYDSDYHQTGVNARKSQVIIGNHVWIGSRAMLMKGARIGNGAIVSANAWVTGKVKEKSMVSGMPAKRLMDCVEWKM